MDTTIMKQRLRGALIGGLGFGIGFVLYGAFINEMTTELLRDWLDKPHVPSFLGYTIYIITWVMGCSIGGAIGGFSLSVSKRSAQRWRYIWAGALSFAISLAVMVYPSITVIDTVSWLINRYVGGPLSTLGALIGVAMGALNGLLLKLMTRHQGRTPALVLYGSLGFGVGGWLVGVRDYFILSVLPIGSTISIEHSIARLTRLFIFGACGGAVLGAFYSSLPGDEEQNE